MSYMIIKSQRLRRDKNSWYRRKSEKLSPEPVFLLSSDLAFRELLAGFCIIFLQKLTSEDLNNELLARHCHKIYPEVAKQRLRVEL